MIRGVVHVVLLTLATGRVVASPSGDPTSGRAVFTGATMPGATSIVLDPAALGLGTFTEVTVAESAVVDMFSIDRKAIDINTGALSPAGSVRDNELGLGLPAISIVYHPEPHVTVAGEFRGPPPIVFPNGQDLLRYHTLGGSQRALDVSVGVAIRVFDWFYFGASGTHEDTYLKLSYARDTALANGRGPNGIDSNCGAAPCGIENPLATERYDIGGYLFGARSKSLVSADNLYFTIGFLFRLREGTWLGFAVRAPPGLSLTTELDGTMTVTRAPRDGGGVVQGGATVYVSLPPSADAELRSRLVQNLDLHIGAHAVYLNRETSYDVRGYGANFAAANIPEWTVRPLGYNNTFALWAGVEQVETSKEHFSDRLRLGARVGFETAQVDNERTSPMAIGPTSLTFDVGAQLRPWRLSRWIVELSYGVQYFPLVHVVDSGFDPRNAIACADSGFDYLSSACTASRNGYAIDTAAGDYQRIEHAMRFALRIQW